MLTILSIFLCFGSMQCEELDMIDQEIKSLTDQQNLYRAKAAQQDDLGQRLQFEGEYKDEARQAYKLADMNRQKMAVLQEQIDLLEKKKQEILKNGK